MTYFIAGTLFGFFLAMAGFVLLNIKKPALLDSAEDKVRKYGDKP